MLQSPDTPSLCCGENASDETIGLLQRMFKSLLGLVWFGLVWFGLVWFGLVWFGLVWFG